MLLEVTKFVCDTAVKLWDMLLGGGVFGKFIILAPVLYRLFRVMRHFTK